MRKIYHAKINTMLKKFGMALAITAVTGLSLYAQEDARSAPGPINTASEAYPGYSGPSNEPVNTPDALWDVQFDHNVTSATGGAAGMAAAQFINNEFWTSRWQNDTLYRFDINGTLIQAFTIPGLTGTRSLASDGTYLYAGTATTTIYRIDPTTRTLAPPHINSASPNTARHCSYDPTLNGGAGGFWIGNFGTDIDAISMTGAVLTTIPAANHGLTGMYGSAYDGTTAGGPYLWIFNQGGANDCQIERLSLPFGTRNVLASRDAFQDFMTSNSLSSGLAGGLFISNAIVPGQMTIGGLIQGTPNNVVFGYELNDLILPNNDAGVADLLPSKGYTQIPLAQTSGEVFSATATNFGGNAIASMNIDFSVEFNGSSVFTNTQTATNVASGQSVTLTSTAFSPSSGVGTYVVKAYAYPQGQMDPNPVNDTTSFTFMVTDSTFARDDNQPDGGNGYAVSSTSWAYAVAKFETPRPDTLTSVWIELATPNAGDTTYAVVANTSAGVPTTVLYTGPAVIIGASNTYVLPIPGGLSLPAGTYSIGCYEGANTTINLAQSPNYFIAGQNHFFTPAGGWTQSGIATARFIRPNFGTVVGVSIDPALEMGITISPNPTTENFNIFFHEAINANVNIKVMNPVGQVVREMNMNPAIQNDLTVQMDGAANGVYFVRMEMDGKVSTRKVVIAR